MNNEPNKKNILDDRRIRLALSVLGAIVAWMVVTIIVQPGTSNTIYNVPVDYTYDSAAYTSRGLSIVSAEDKTVNLKISGDGYTIGGLTASDFVVYPDFSSVRDSGEKTLRLLVRGANGLLNGVTVTMEGNDNTVDCSFFSFTSSVFRVFSICFTVKCSPDCSLASAMAFSISSI